MSLDREIAGSEGGRLHRAMLRFRAFMGRHLVLLWIYRLAVILLGFLCLLAGIIMLVTPGPGWLFIFLGMGLWGSEFPWAHRLNVWAKAKVLGAWRGLEARRQRRLRLKQEKIWSGRERSNHYCPKGDHYH